MWIFHLYVATFQQHLHMEYTSLSWNDCQLHDDRLHEFGYPFSILCHKWTLICLVCTNCRSCLLFWLMTCHHMWHMIGCWHHLWSRILVTILSFVFNSMFSNVNHCLPFVLSLFWPVSFGMLALVTQMISSNFPYGYWDSRILYFVVLCVIIRLHQSKQAHSTTWQTLLICKYQIISIFPCCNLQNMNMFSQ